MESEMELADPLRTKCGAITDPSRLADDLKLITGVVEHGLFLDLADEAIIGRDDGVEVLVP